MSNEIVQPDIIYSNNWAFRKVEHGTILPEGERVWKHTSYPQSFLDKYNIPPFNYIKTEYAISDGVNPVDDLKKYWGTRNHVFYVADMALTEEYRLELYENGEGEYMAKDGNLYYPAPLDCTPDLAVGVNSGREVISGDNPWGSRLVSTTRDHSKSNMVGWNYYLKKDSEFDFSEDLLEQAYAITEELYGNDEVYEEPEELLSPEELIDKVLNKIDALEQRVRRLEIREERDTFSS